MNNIVTNTMNIPALTEIAEWLEGGAKHRVATFDMTKGIEIKEQAFVSDAPSECGSSCCIAGAAVQFMTPAEIVIDIFPEFGYEDVEEIADLDLDWQNVFSVARGTLGLTWKQAADLFAPGYDLIKDGSRMTEEEVLLIHTEDNGEMKVPHSEYLNFYNQPLRAARVVRNLIATGEVDWGV